jgi:hypothetical protein
VFGFIGLGAETPTQTYKTVVVQESRLVKVIFFFYCHGLKLFPPFNGKSFVKAKT